MGFCYIKILQSGTDLCHPLIRFFEMISNIGTRKNKSERKFKPKKSPLKVVRNNDENTQSKLDLLLDKINEKGYNSLSNEEKAWLDKVSKER